MLSPNFKLILLFVFLSLSFFPTGDSAQAYFLLNSDCKTTRSCIGDTNDLSVICVNSRCRCDPRLGVYDTIRWKCVGKANHACLGELCTRNSICDATTNTCQCHAGYSDDFEGRCVHGHDESCDENEDCKSDLACGEKRCECRNPNHQYYHAGNDTCYSVVQSLHADMKRNEENRKEEKSSVYVIFEALLLLALVGVLIAIAVLLSNITKILKEVTGGYIFREYLSKSGLCKLSLCKPAK